MQRPLIFAIEDELAIRRLLENVLTAEGYGFDSSGSMRDFLQREVAGVDLFVVDLGLPDGNGQALVRRLRQETEAGIIVLTGRAGENEQVLSLETGADDFVAKPFRPRELVARVNALMRRLGASAKRSSEAGNPSGIYSEFGEYSANLSSRIVTRKDGLVIDLTTAEFDLLAAFLKRKGEVLGRETLISLMKGRHWSSDDRRIDGLVSRLRRKLPVRQGQPHFIRTIHGTGYIFAEVYPADGSADAGG